MQKGQNQKTIRNINLELFFNEFIRGNFSKADIAKNFNVSKTASAKIFAELLNFDLIREVESSESRIAPGTRPTYYSINPDFGLIGTFDLSSMEVVLSIRDLSGAILAETKIPNMEQISSEDIQSLCECFQKMLDQPAIKGKKLARICVALPCAIDSVHNKIFWSPRFYLTEDIDLNAIFKKRFNTKTIIVNDVQLLMRGEEYDAIISKQIKYALLLYIDGGIGGALYINGRLEGGQYGLAGDMGYYPVKGRDGEFTMLDNVASINGLKKSIINAIRAGAESVLSDKIDNLHFRDIKKAYLEDGDPLTKRIVNESAEVVAAALKSFIRFLNIPFIIISGRICQLGEEYINIIRKNLNGTFLFPMHVNYSALGKEAINKGALIISLKDIMEEKIKSR